MVTRFYFLHNANEWKGQVNAAFGRPMATLLLIFILIKRERYLASHGVVFTFHIQTVLRSRDVPST